MFALTYGGHFNSQHCEQMDSATRRWHLKRLYQQKITEDEQLKKARAEAKVKKSRR